MNGSRTVGGPPIIHSRMAKATLSARLSELSGGLGEFAIVPTSSGSVFRHKPRYRRPVSSAQREALDRLGQANALWAGFDQAHADAWRRYAQSLSAASGSDRTPRATIGYRAFVGLATKFMQVNPGAPVPTVPPSTVFIPEMPLIQAAVVAGGIRFTASSWNAPGQTTELLIQPLANVRRQPGTRYTSAGFHVFAPGSPTFVLGLGRGVYACAIRPVERATGRQGLVMPVGVVLVG